MANTFRYLPYLLFLLPVLLQAQRPMEYNCRYTSVAPLIDGRPADVCWNQAPWTHWFTDIEGDKKPAPTQNTRVKMLWDNQHLYILAELQEEHLWATLSQRESVIYYDNDFEVFLDPDGDNHHYFELEINALGTEWDLFLNRPYKDGGKALTSWDISGLETAVYLQGTLNNPSDTDTAWYVEISIPFAALRPYGLSKKEPAHLQVWRLNFSRVQWDLEIEDKGYRKKTDPETRRPLPEHNWVWSPQSVINMHRPETWGYLIFLKAEERPAGFDPDPDYEIKALLHRYYYAQKAFQRQHQRYSELETLSKEMEIPLPESFSIEYTSRHFLIRAQTQAGSWYINHLSRIWHEPLKQ